MNKERQAPAKQLDITLYLCLVVDFLARPKRAAAQTTAQITTLAAILDIVGLIIVFRLLMSHLATVKQNSITTKSSYRSLLSWIAIFIFSVSAGEVASTAFLFLRSAMEWDIPSWLFLACLVGTAGYAAHLGICGVTRAGEVLLILLGVSVGLVLVSNVSNMTAENLSQAPLTLFSVLKTAVTNFRCPISALAWFVLSTNRSPKECAAGFEKVFAALLVSYLIFTVGAELVLGENAAGESQPFYSMAQVGGLSVFKRLDHLHSFFWLLILVHKTVLLLCAAHFLLGKILPAKLYLFEIWICMALAYLGAFAALATTPGAWEVPMTLMTLLLLFGAAGLKGEKVRSKHK